MYLLKLAHNNVCDPHGPLDVQQDLTFLEERERPDVVTPPLRDDEDGPCDGNNSLVTVAPRSSKKGRHCLPVDSGRREPPPLLFLAYSVLHRTVDPAVQVLFVLVTLELAQCLHKHQHVRHDGLYAFDVPLQDGPVEDGKGGLQRAVPLVCERSDDGSIVFG